MFYLNKVLFSLDDIQLAKAFIAGEAHAFNTVYHHFVGPVRYFIEQVVKDARVAEDLTAEAFIKTFERNTEFGNLYKMRGFLYTTANNAAA